MITKPTSPALLPLALITLILGVPALSDAEEPPTGWTARVLDSFDALPFSLSQPPAGLLRGQFGHFSLNLARDARVSGASALWRFSALQADAPASLLLAKPPALDALAIHVKNPDQAALQVTVRLTDAAGETWRSRPAVLGDQKGWFQYVFRLAEFTGTGGNYPASPFQTLELLVTGMERDKPYRLYLDELRLLTAPPPELRLSGLQASREAQAGQSLPVRVTLHPGGQAARPVRVIAELKRGASPVSLTGQAVVPDPGSPQTLNLALPVPARIASGSYRLVLSLEGAALLTAPEQEIVVAGAAPLTRTAIVPPARGGGFLVEGKPLPPVGGWYAGRTLPRQASWVMFHCTSDFDPTGHAAPVWTAPDKFDYTALDCQIAALLSANPDAYLVPVIHLSSPPWWDQAHPRELMVFGDGKTVLPGSVPGAKRTHAAWTSTVWRKDAAAALAKLLQHLETGPFAPAIIGYQLASGEDGRWAYPGASQGVFADYSRPQQEAFRAWLKDKYKEVKALRVAWSQPALPVNAPEALKESAPILGWNQVRIPDQVQRLRAPSGVIHDPNAAQEIVDYQIFCSDAVAETIRYFAAAAREATGDRKLIGAGYGHVFDLAATRCGVQNGGHLALAPICQASELSFLASAGTFGEPGGPPLITAAHSSITSHDKAWVTLAAERHGPAALVSGVIGGGLVALEGYSPDKLPLALRTLPPQLPRNSAAEVALIVDDISAAYTACGPELLKPLLSDQRVSLSLLGAPVDVWTLDDLMEGRALGYKLYIFPNCFYLDSEWRKQLVSLLAQQPCTALWIYAPGAIDANIGGRTMKDLTGLTLVPWSPRRADDAASSGGAEKGLLQVKVADGYVYGAPTALTPRFVCVDDKADIRGTLAGTSFGGLAVKDLGNVKSVWSAAPHLPASLLRALASDADVHLYADDGDGVYANQNIIALRAAADGEHIVRLPRLAQVYDLADGKPVGKKGSEFRVRLQAGQIGLYYYGAAPLGER